MILIGVDLHLAIFFDGCAAIYNDIDRYVTIYIGKCRQNNVITRNIAI